MKPALLIYTILVVGISLVGAASVASNTSLPDVYAKQRVKEYCTYIQDFDEDNTPVIGSSCSGSMKDCKKDPERIDKAKCVKIEKFDFP